VREHKKASATVLEYLKESKETWNAFRWVWQEFITVQSKRWAYFMLVFLFGSQLTFMLQPLAFSWMVNAVADKSLQALMVGGGALGATMCLRWGGDFVRNLSREWILNRNLLQLTDRVNHLFAEKSLGQHYDESATFNFENIEKAVNRIWGVQEMLLFELGGYLSSLLLAYILLFWLSPVTGAIGTILILIHVFWSMYLNHRVAVVTTPLEKEFRAHHRQMVERWSKIERVKTNGKTKSENERLSRWLDRTLIDDRRFWFWFCWQSMIREFCGAVACMFIISYGSYLVYSGQAEIGFLVPLYTWAIKLTGDLWYIGHAERRLNEQVPYIKSLREALTKPAAFSEYDGVALTTESHIAVKFDGVNCRFGENAGTISLSILRDISFTIESGEKVALIGPSGAGKTTIMKLLLRFMDPSGGEIRINGNRLQDLSLSSWMEHVGYIPQHAQIFDGTIRYNLTFGLSEERQRSITDEEIWEIMRLLQIDFGERLTDGLETVVGKNGIKLSGGQAQRLMIGAAVIKKPIFMVIDEATSSLDSSTEKAVQEGLHTVLQGSVGALIVAHRLSTVRTICNRFMVLRPLEDVGPDKSQIEAVANSFEALHRISPTFRKLSVDQGVVIHP
jgi:ATP-binding cassette, subfamily B, heavy metal transporter